MRQGNMRDKTIDDVKKNLERQVWTNTQTYPSLSLGYKPIRWGRGSEENCRDSKERTGTQRPSKERLQRNT